MINYGYLMSVAVYLIMPVTDRETKMRGLLHLSGSSILAYWLGMFLCDLLLFLIPTFFFLLMAKTFDLGVFGDAIGSLSLILFGFGISLLQLTYLVQNIFSNITQAIRCVIPVFLLFGTVLPLVIYMLAGIAGESSEFELYFWMGLLYTTTPMFTFYISTVDMIMKDLDDSGSNEEIHLFTDGVMTPSSRSAFGCFVFQALVCFALVLLIDYWKVYRYRVTDPVIPKSPPAPVMQHADIIAHE